MFKSHKTSALIRAIVIAASTSLTLASCGTTGGGAGGSAAPALNTNKQATSVSNSSSSKTSTSSSANSSGALSTTTETTAPTPSVPATAESSTSSNLTLGTSNTSKPTTSSGSHVGNASRIDSAAPTNVTLPVEEELTTNLGTNSPIHDAGNKVSEPIAVPSKPHEPQPAPPSASTPTQVKPATGEASPDETASAESSATGSRDSDLTLAPRPTPELEVVGDANANPSGDEERHQALPTESNSTPSGAETAGAPAAVEETNNRENPELAEQPAAQPPEAQPRPEAPEVSLDSANAPSSDSRATSDLTLSQPGTSEASASTVAGQPGVSSEPSSPEPDAQREVANSASPANGASAEKTDPPSSNLTLESPVSASPARQPEQTDPKTDLAGAGSPSEPALVAPPSTESATASSVETAPRLEPKSASELLGVNNSSATNTPSSSVAEQPVKRTITKTEFASQVNEFTGVREVGIENFLTKSYYSLNELQAVTESALRQRAKLEHIDGVAATDFTLKATTSLGHQRFDLASVPAVTGHQANFVKSLLGASDAGHAVPFVASGRSLTTAQADGDGFITDAQSPLFGLVKDDAGKVAVIDFGPQFTAANKNRIEYAFSEPDRNNTTNAPYLADVTQKTANNFVATHGDLVLWRLQASDVPNTVPGLMRDHGKIRFLGGNQANYQGYYLGETLNGLNKGGVLEQAIKDGYRIVNMSFGVVVDPVKLGDFLKSKGDNTVAHALWMQRTWGWITRKTLEGEFLSSLRQIKFTDVVDRGGVAYNQYNGRDYANTLEALTQRDVLAVNAIGNKSNAYDLLSLYLALDRERYPNAFKGTLYATSYDAKRDWTPTSCHDLRDICVAAPSYVTYQYSSDTLQALNAAHLYVNRNPEVNGTSFSAPYVSSVAALVRSVFPWMSNHNLQQTILTTAKDIGAKGIDSRYGWGLIQPQDAVNGPKIFQFADSPFVADLDHNRDLNIVGNDKRFYFYNQISGVGGLEVRGGKSANNALVLANTNTYTGTTKVSNQGFLVLDGNLVTSDVVVEGNSRFQGRGLVKNLKVQGSELVAYNYPQATNLDQLVRVNPNTRGKNIYVREFAQEGFSYNNSLIVYNYLNLDANSTTRIYLGQPVLVGQMATLNNSTLQVDGIARMILTPGSYAYGEVLFAADGIEGTFGKVNFTSPLLTQEGLTEQEQASFSKVDHNGNQVAGNTRVPQTFWLKVKYNGVVSSLPRITSAQDAQRNRIAVGAQNLDTITQGLAQVDAARGGTTLFAQPNSSSLTGASPSFTPSWNTSELKEVFSQLEPLVTSAQQDAANFQLEYAQVEEQEDSSTPAPEPTLAQADENTIPAINEELRFEARANTSQGTPVSSAPTSSAMLVSQELGNLAGLNREQVRELALGFAGSEFVAARNHHNLITTATLRTQVDNAVAKVITEQEGLTLNASSSYEQTNDLTKLEQNHFQLAYKSGDDLVTLHFTKGEGSWKSQIMTQAASSNNLGVAVGYQHRIPTLGGWAGLFGTYQQVQDEFTRRWSLANTTYAFNHQLGEENYGLGISYADYKVFTPGHRLGLYGAILGLNTQVGATSETFGNLRTGVNSQQDLSLFLMSGVNYELHNLFNWGLNLDTAYGIVVAHQDNQFQNLHLQLLENGKVAATVANNLAFSDDLTANKVKVYHTGSMTLSKTWKAWKVGVTLELHKAKELSKKAQLNLEYRFN